MLTLLEKRLIALSHLGIRIEHDSGHRWILSTETDFFDFESACRDSGVLPCKIYGGINKALDEVDKVLIHTKYLSLENEFNSLRETYAEEPEDYIVIC